MMLILSKCESGGAWNGFSSDDTIKEMIEGSDFTDLASLRARVFSKLNMMICQKF